MKTIYILEKLINIYCLTQKKIFVSYEELQGINKKYQKKIKVNWQYNSKRNT